MELDKVNLTFSKVSAVDAVKEYSHRNPGQNSFVFVRDLDASSKSAPLLVGKDSDSAERFIPMKSRTESQKMGVTSHSPSPVQLLKRGLAFSEKKKKGQTKIHNMNSLQHGSFTHMCFPHQMKQRFQFLYNQICKFLKLDEQV